MASPAFNPEDMINKTKAFFEKIRAPLPVKPTKMGALLFFLTFLCARATLLSTLRPFGGALFAALCSKKHGYVYMIAAILGQISTATPFYQSGKYIFAMTFFALIIDRFPPKMRKRPFIRGGMFAFSLALSGFCFTLASSGGFIFATFYDMMLLFIECVCAFCATGAFCIAVPIVTRLQLAYTFSSGDEISLVSLIGCALWGAKDISQLGLINISDTVCILVILIFAIRLGSDRGAVAGLTMGLVSALGSGRLDLSGVSFAFSGLAAGILGTYGAATGCLGFIFANALVTMLANGSTETLINLSDILAACFIYSIIPQKIFQRLTSFGTRDEKSRITEDEHFHMEHVLSNVQRVVVSLGTKTDRLREKRHPSGDSEQKFYERLARRACSGCGMRKLCWQQKYKKTTSLLKKALYSFCETGTLDPTLLPPNCLRPGDMQEAFLQMSDVYRSDVIWQGRLNELKKASHNQFYAFCEILKATAKTLSAPVDFDRALAEDISRRMDAAGMPCRNTVVMRDLEHEPTVMLQLSPCGGFSMCEKGAAEVISAACGIKMVRSGKKDCNACHVKYTPVPENRINFALARIPRSKRKVSGDNAAFRVINKNLYAAVLTDGMGYGESAALEARGAADMLLDLIEVGVDGETAVKIVNSLLVPFDEATFAATDLFLYDASSGRGRIVKCGGAASFAKSGDRVDAFYSKSMPLGSTVTENLETFTLSAKEGDIVVMISDGVLESSAKTALKDAWLINELENLQDTDPDRIVNLIAKKALEKCAMNPRDDITVLAGRVE